jgi:enamine deaminase RidA (YjgF/YER057c/UK114 family)
MEKQIFNPWSYQEKFGYAQAVEVKNATSTLYCAGQAAINADGQPSEDQMEGQLVQALENLEMVISNAGYQCQDIVRLNIFTTSATDFFNSFQVFTDWISEHGVKEAMTLLEVKGLAFDTLKIELEATVVK